MSNQKLEALAKFLDEDQDAIFESSETQYEVGAFREYLVLTDEEADDLAKSAILDSVWAFKPSFLRCHMRDIDEDILELIQENKCEDANPTFLKLIDDQDHFVDDAIRCDGRGRFLSGYDGEEHEENGFFIYRIN